LRISEALSLHQANTKQQRGRYSMNKKFLVVNSFSGDCLWGNPAGVFLDAQGLVDKQLQQIAKQLNLVETVFVFPTEHADFAFRYFTPNKEIPVAGHPTIAAFIGMIYTKKIDLHMKNEYRINTLAGIREVVIEEKANNISVRMKQSKPSFFPPIDNREEVALTLGIKEEELIADLPIQPIDLGLRELIVPVNSLNSLMKIQRQLDPLQQLCNKLNVREIQAFSFESYNDLSDVHTRNICPREGIEDPACGMGNAALGAYLAHYNYFNENKDYILAEQGMIVKMPSQIEIAVSRQGSTYEIFIGGTGKIVIEGSFFF
jgi:trans-2,3-dihydro-3-hydroxyanthranilate isomerase